jgi:hypothetical protein
MGSYTVYIYGIFGREVTKYGVIYGIYGVYIRYFWQGNNQIWGHIRCIYRFLATLLVSHSWQAVLSFTPSPPLLHTHDPHNTHSILGLHQIQSQACI